MPRVKRGVIAHKKREKLLRHVKGFRWSRKSKERAAKEALLHARSRSYRGRKERKRVFRALWQTQINAAAREHGTTYSRLMHALKKNNVALDRKSLAALVQKDPEAFKKLLALASE